MINHILISFSAVQIYELSYIHLCFLPSTGIIRTHKVAEWEQRWRGDGGGCVTEGARTIMLEVNTFKVYKDFTEYCK